MFAVKIVAPGQYAAASIILAAAIAPLANKFMLFPRFHRLAASKLFQIPKYCPFAQTAYLA